MQTNVLVLSLCLVVKLHYYAWDFLSIFKKKEYTSMSLLT